MAAKQRRFNEDCADCDRELKQDRAYRAGRVKYMTHAKGYVMVRKPGAVPFVLSQKEWLALPFVG